MSPYRTQDQSEPVTKSPAGMWQKILSAGGIVLGLLFVFVVPVAAVCAVILQVALQLFPVPMYLFLPVVIGIFYLGLWLSSRVIMLRSHRAVDARWQRLLQEKLEVHSVEIDCFDALRALSRLEQFVFSQRHKGICSYDGLSELQITLSASRDQLDYEISRKRGRYSASIAIQLAMLVAAFGALLATAHAVWIPLAFTVVAPYFFRLYRTAVLVESATVVRARVENVLETIRDALLNGRESIPMKKDEFDSAMLELMQGYNILAISDLSEAKDSAANDGPRVRVAPSEVEKSDVDELRESGSIERKNGEEYKRKKG